MKETGSETGPETDTTTKESAPQTTNKKKCLICNKRIGLTGFACRCGGLFCGAHRAETAHGCTFDFKAAATATLETKLVKIDSTRDKLAI